MTKNQATLLIGSLYEYAERDIQDFAIEYVKKNWTQYDKETVEKAINRVIKEEKFLKNANLIACVESRIKETVELDKKDAERLISQIERKILNIGRYRTPKKEQFTEIQRALIADFGGWIKTCDRFDEFKWFVRNAVESGISKSGRYSKNALKGKHEIENKRLENANKDAKALTEIIERANK